MKIRWTSKIIALALPLLVWAIGASATPSLSNQLPAGDSGVSSATSGTHSNIQPATLPPTGQPYHSLKMASASDGWVVGQGGLIKRYMAGQWLDYPSPVTSTLNAVAANSTDAWIVGEGNTILHLVSNKWQPVASPAPAGSSLVDVDIVATGEVWIIGSPAVMLHYSGGNWSLGPTPPTIGPISWGSPSDAWLVNGTNTAYHYINGSWIATDLAGNIADGVFMLTPDLGWMGLYSEYMGASYANEYMQYTSATGWQPWPCVGQYNGCPTPTPGLSSLAPTRHAVPNCTQVDTDIYNLVAFTTTDFFAASDVSRSEDCGTFQTNYYLWRNLVSSNQRDIDLGNTYTHTFALSGSSGSDLWMLGNNAIRHWDGISITIVPLCVNPYSDVPADYYALSQIEYLTCHGIVAGMGSNTFSPNAPAQRIEFAKMITLARGWAVATPSGGQTFSDVPSSNPLYPYVETAYQHGAISGGDTQSCAAHHVAYPCFLPSDPISRAQAVVITARAFGWPIDTSGGPHFRDVSPQSFAYAAVETGYHRAVISGLGGGLFAPNRSITRAQLALVLYGALTLP